MILVCRGMRGATSTGENTDKIQQDIVNIYLNGTDVLRKLGVESI